MKEQEIKYKIARAIAERQLTKQGINDSTDAIYKILEEQLTLGVVSNQRELLIAFAKYMEEDKMYERHDEANVEDFLDNHSN